MLNPYIEAAIRRIVQEELSKFAATPIAPQPVVAAPAPVVEEQPKLPIPEWESAYNFQPRLTTSLDWKVLQWLAKHQHAYRYLPDPLHNPFCFETKPEDRAKASEGFWKSGERVQTLLPKGTQDAQARTYAVANRRHFGPNRWRRYQICQGLAGEKLPIPYPGKEMEWTYIPEAMLAPLRASMEFALRPLDGAARPPLPHWFEPVHPYSVVVHHDSFVFLFGPRSPARGRPVLVEGYK